LGSGRESTQKRRRGGGKWEGITLSHPTFGLGSTMNSGRKRYILISVTHMIGDHMFDRILIISKSRRHGQWPTIMMRPLDPGPSAPMIDASTVLLLFIGLLN